MGGGTVVEVVGTSDVAGVEEVVGAAVVEGRAERPLAAATLEGSDELVRVSEINATVATTSITTTARTRCGNGLDIQMWRGP